MGFYNWQPSLVTLSSKIKEKIKILPTMECGFPFPSILYNAFKIKYPEHLIKSGPSGKLFGIKTLATLEHLKTIILKYG